MFENLTRTKWFAQKRKNATVIGVNDGDDAKLALIFTGTGAPEGVVTAPPGSIYFRQAETVTNIYTKATGTGNTGWVIQAPWLYGTTANRPTVSNGTMYWDTDLLRPIWKTGGAGVWLNINNPRIVTTSSSATPATNVTWYDQHNITALAVDITSMSSGLSGTPADGQFLRFRIKGTASRAITWGASFDGNLLATTDSTNTHIQECVYDAAAAKWIGTYSDATGY